MESVIRFCYNMEKVYEERISGVDESPIMLSVIIGTPDVDLTEACEDCHRKYNGLKIYLVGIGQHLVENGKLGFIGDSVVLHFGQALRVNELIQDKDLCSLSMHCENR